MDKSNKYEIPKDWFTSEEAKERRKKIEESSKKLMQSIAGSKNIDEILKLKIGPHRYDN